jgi:hypothetical protein
MRFWPKSLISLVPLFVDHPLSQSGRGVEGGWRRQGCRREDEGNADRRPLVRGVVRADGRKTHDAYLFEVKKPTESKYPGDFYKTRATIPAAEAFRPLKEGGCPLVNG